MALRNLRFAPGLGDGLGDTCEQLLRDAGLMPGMGQGTGTGDGSSAQRNSLENVGLYGGLPGLDAMPGDRPSSSGRMGSGGGSNVRTGEAGRPGSVDPRNPQAAGGSGEGAVPVQYRRRVAEYFQRLADESGGK
jgi:hypothetical protein